MEIGEIRKGKEIGKGRGNYICHSCEGCGLKRWVRISNGTPNNPYYNPRCSACSQKGCLGSNWKGGRVKTSGGYIRVYVSSDNIFSPMAPRAGNQQIYVLEHRLVIAQSIGRCLHPWEVVHHKNGIKDDNRIENLELLGSNGGHNTYLNQYIKKLERQLQRKQEVFDEFIESRPDDWLEGYKAGVKRTRELCRK